MLNVVAIMGRLVADPELRTTTSGINMARFRIACDRNFARQGEQRQADFLDVVAWRSQADFVCKYFQKGSLIVIDGSIQTRQYQDKNGNNRTAVEIVANNINFAGPKNSSGSNAGGASYGSQPRQHAQPAARPSNLEAAPSHPARAPPPPPANGENPGVVYPFLPAGSAAEPDRRYPVLYMFDGQNVFWDQDATYGKSWGMERFLDTYEVPLVVAALQCNTGRNNERLDEYSPYRFDDPQFGHFDGHGDDTMRWFIQEFKPFVDANVRTLPDRAHTFIAGSSMGGLMSLYALFQYNHIFGRAAALSPSIWVSPEKLKSLVARSKVRQDTVLYMDYGSREMGNHAGMRRDFGAFGAKVMGRGVHLTMRIVPGGTHSEASWEKQLPFVMETLFYDLDDPQESND